MTCKLWFNKELEIAVCVWTSAVLSVVSQERHQQQRAAQDPQDCVTAPSVPSPSAHFSFFIERATVKPYTSKCPSMGKRAVTNHTWRFHTYVRMVQYLHYSYFSKQLLKKDKTYSCLKNRKVKQKPTEIHLKTIPCVQDCLPTQAEN